MVIVLQLIQDAEVEERGVVDFAWGLKDDGA